MINIQNILKSDRNVQINCDDKQLIYEKPFFIVYLIGPTATLRSTLEVTSSLNKAIKVLMED